MRAMVQQIVFLFSGKLLLHLIWLLFVTTNKYPHGKNIILSREVSKYQDKTYSSSSGFQAKEIEESFDKLSANVQDLKYTLDRALKVPVGSPLVDMGFPQPKAGKVLKWSDNEKELVNSEYSIDEISVFVDQVLENIEYINGKVVEAAEMAELARTYAQQVEYGVRWQTFAEANWVAVDDKYTMTLDEASLIILGIYRVIDGKKEKVVNIDISIENNKVTLTSPEAFNGGFLAASKTLGNYVHEQTLAANEWLITHNLGKYPVVTLVDYEGFVQIATVQYLSLNQIRVTFESEVSGFAYLS